MIWGTTEVAQRLIRGFGYDLILPAPGEYLPRQDVIPLMLPTVYAMGGQKLSGAEIKILGPDRGDWYLSDGIVNTASMNGPLGTDVSPISGFLQKTLDERRGCYWHFGVTDKMDHADEIGVWVEETTVSVFSLNPRTCCSRVCVYRQPRWSTCTNTSQCLFLVSNLRRSMSKNDRSQLPKTVRLLMWRCQMLNQPKKLSDIVLPADLKGGES